MNYSMLNTQKIKTLQQKIAEYQTSLVTLKEGHSTETLLHMKNELDDLKLQVSQIEDTKERDNSANENNTNVIELMKQLELINKAVEEMNLEISFILNQISQSNTTSLAQQSVKTISPTILPNLQKNMEESVKPVNFENIPPIIPSFNDLQRIAGKMIITNTVTQNDPPPLQHNNEEIILLDKHFNEQYFQAAETFPKRIYNGLYKNKEKKPAIRFKNVNKKAEEEIDEIEVDQILVSDSKSKEERQSSLTAVMESPNELESNDCIQLIEENESIEESSYLEQKKEKSTSIFNIFKRWNKSEDS